MSARAKTLAVRDFARSRASEIRTVHRQVLFIRAKRITRDSMSGGTNIATRGTPP